MERKSASGTGGRPARPVPVGAGADTRVNAATGTSAGILIEDVTVERGHRRIFEGLSLRMAEARIGLVGDNGAGKSSLFRLICGLDQPLRGRVQAWGESVRGGARRVGLLFQNPDDQIIFPTVAEELAFSLTAAGESRPAARRQAQQFLEQRGLGDWGERAVGELSQGQRQQVCLLALQIGDPATLLLDEPYSSLDLPSQARLAVQLETSGQQIILSTHQLAHVRHFERVLWLEAGRVKADGNGADVCDAYAEAVRRRVGAEQCAERGAGQAARQGAGHA